MASENDYIVQLSIFCYFECGRVDKLSCLFCWKTVYNPVYRKRENKDGRDKAINNAVWEYGRDKLLYICDVCRWVSVVEKEG